jgi:CDGSH-type Zn-finger protein
MSEPTSPQRFPYVKDMPAGTYYWCACGNSKNQPFCDGSHQGTEFSPVKVELAAAKKVAFCGCKHSKNGALCDGSHARM